MAYRHRAHRLLAGATAFVLALTLAPSVNAADASGRGRHDFVKVGYFVQWGIYERGFFVKNLEANGSAGRLTHINYAFGNVKPDPDRGGDVVCLSADPWADYQRPVSAAESVDGVADPEGASLRGNFNQLKKLKAKHPGLKVLISLGGWTLSKYFSDGALTAESRRTLVESCIDLFIEGNLPGAGGVGGPGSGAGVFDGIDLDWEWPGSVGNDGNIIRPEDKRNFTKLVAEFRAQLDDAGADADKHYELTAFLPAAPAKIDAGFEVREVFAQLDFATVQGYDFHGTWERTTNHQAQLYSPAGDPDPAGFSLDLAIDSYRARGAPAGKLVVGVPYFGRGWTGVPGANNGLYQTSTGAAPGKFEAGVEDFKVFATKPGRHHRDPVNGAHWLYDGTEWWSYDDPITVARKMLYVRLNRLGGAMVWSLDADDTRGTLTATIDVLLR
jgi:chitinase